MNAANPRAHSPNTKTAVRPCRSARERAAGRCTRRYIQSSPASRAGQQQSLRARALLPSRGPLHCGAGEPDEPPQLLEPEAKRERERERCVSEKLTHLVTAWLPDAKTPGTYVPLETTRKPTPSFKDPVPLPKRTRQC